MKLRHVSSVKIPSINAADGNGTKAVLGQLMRLIYDTFIAIYDDLFNLSVSTVTALSTASKDNLGKFHLKTNVGAIDTLHICVYDLSDTSYKWQQVTLS